MLVFVCFAMVFLCCFCFIYGKMFLLFLFVRYAVHFCCLAEKTYANV